MVIIQVKSNKYIKIYDLFPLGPTYYNLAFPRTNKFRKTFTARPSRSHARICPKKNLKVIGRFTDEGESAGTSNQTELEKH